jgi:uncharacterized protein YndB with AHSA1/START domain
MSNSELIFQTTRLLEHPCEEVFAAFSDPNRLKMWWGPNGFSNAFEVFDFQQGGEWKFTMIGPDGSQYQNHSRFALINPTKEITIEHLNAPHFTLNIQCLPHGTKTQLIWTQTFEELETAQALKAMVTQANEENLDRLTKILTHQNGSTK